MSELPTTDGADPVGKQRSNVRPVAVAILIILASLGVVVSLVGWWVRSTLFDTDSFMEVVETSLSSEEVTTVLGDAISEQVVTALDIEGRLEEGLGAIDTYLSDSLADALDLSPSAAAFFGRLDLFRLADLAAPIAAPVNESIEEGVDDLVRSGAFQETLPDAVAFAHRGAVALIRDDAASLPNVTVVEGEVRWNVLPLVARSIAYLLTGGSVPAIVNPVEVPDIAYDDPRSEMVVALGSALGKVLPEDFGEVTIMSEDNLEGWQSLARILDRVVLAVILLTVALALAAFVLSADRRRSLVQIAFGSVVAVLVAWLVQSSVLAAVDAAIGGQSQQAAVDVLFGAVFASLRSVSLLYIVVAGVIGVSAHVAGRPRWLTALRHPGQRDRHPGSEPPGFDQFVAAHRDAFAIAGLVIAVGIWWLVGLSVASIIIIGAGLGGYLWYVTRVATAADQDSLAETTVG